MGLDWYGQGEHAMREGGRNFTNEFLRANGVLMFSLVVLKASFISMQPIGAYLDHFKRQKKTYPCLLLAAQFSKRNHGKGYLYLDTLN